MIIARLRSSLRSALGGYLKSHAGAAAAEFALVLTLMAVPLLNAFDIGSYVYDRMELDNAAQAAVQTAWAQCAPSGKVPATLNNNCAGLSAAMTASARTTALGADVTITSTSEKYCCPGAGTVTCSGAGLGPVATTTPAACSSGQQPGDYIFITASYTYTAHSGLSIASLLTTPIVRTAWMRLS
jgi:Flp pilus assembly protein TadG